MIPGFARFTSSDFYDHPDPKDVGWPVLYNTLIYGMLAIPAAIPGIMICILWETARGWSPAFGRTLALVLGTYGIAIAFFHLTPFVEWFID
jgi:hypothetical protein